MDLHQIIKRPLVTEKSMILRDTGNQYAFVVESKANKHQIRTAVEKLFKVHVADIKTAIVRGKIKRVGRNSGKRPNWKKALVTLKEGEKIELFEGV